MGTEPEEVERALRGRRTLPEPEPRKGSGPSDAQPSKKEGKRGPRGELLGEGEERSFEVRGGRFNASATDER
jgi:hypothetical protein